MDEIHIKNLSISGIIGLNSWERKKKQEILINAKLMYDIKKAGESDKIEDSINYRDICKRIIQITENSKPYLIESLIHHIAKKILTEFPLSKIVLSIEKPGALRHSESVGIRITRTKSDYA